MLSHHHAHPYTIQTAAFLIWFASMAFALVVLFAGQALERPVRRRRRPAFQPVIIKRRSATQIPSEHAA